MITLCNHNIWYDEINMRMIANIIVRSPILHSRNCDLLICTFLFFLLPNLFSEMYVKQHSRNLSH